MSASIEPVTDLVIASRSALRAEQRAYHAWLGCGHPSQPPCEHKAEMDRQRASDEAAFSAVLTGLHGLARRGWSAYDRCRCRPGCLAPVLHGDDVVLLDEGYALIAHMVDAYPVEQLALDVEVAS